MKFANSAGKLVLQRTPEEKTPFTQRLARIEGQVRGLRQMIEDDRFCGDELQQVNAVIAAVREVALLLISQQMSGYISKLREDAVGADREFGMTDFVDLLRASYRLS